MTTSLIATEGKEWHAGTPSEFLWGNTKPAINGAVDASFGASGVDAGIAIYGIIAESPGNNEPLKPFNGTWKSKETGKSFKQDKGAFELVLEKDRLNQTFELKLGSSTTTWMAITTAIHDDQLSIKSKSNYPRFSFFVTCVKAL